MSILLSAYFREGIVFAADKNATITIARLSDVEVGRFTKVLSWPERKAVVGFCGLGQLGDLLMDEWLRIFIAGTRGFTDLDDLARRLRDEVQQQFGRDYPAGTPLTGKGLIIHHGGFRVVGGHYVPAMYHIHNVHHRYTAAERVVYTFECNDDLERDFQSWGAADYPARTRERLGEMYDQRDHFPWYNNGYRLEIFNEIKAHVWHLLAGLRAGGVLPAAPSLENWEAYCRMAVEMYGVFLREHVPPSHRYVGGGVDSATVPWPTGIP